MKPRINIRCVDRTATTYRLCALRRSTDGRPDAEPCSNREPEAKPPAHPPAPPVDPEQVCQHLLLTTYDGKKHCRSCGRQLYL